ncbi:Pentatricopeptide repeat-containing protein [Nymphaea thermarum]|nr:Pentatricopeptide repeat-containing protein [Nymphaea thermarum]
MKKKRRRRPNSGFLGVQNSRRPLFVVDLMGEGESSALPSLVWYGKERENQGLQKESSLCPVATMPSLQPLYRNPASRPDYISGYALSASLLGKPDFGLLTQSLLEDAQIQFGFHHLLNSEGDPRGLKHLRKEELVHQLGHAEIDAFLLRCQSDPVIALGLFNWVRNEVGIKPSTRNYCTIVHILAWSRLFGQGMRLLGEVVGTDRQLFVDLIQAAEGCNWNPVVFDMLIKVYVQFGRVQAGMEVFRRMIGIGLLPQVSACNSLLNGLLRSTFDESENPCWEIYEEMRRIGVSPNSYTFNILTHALCMVGDLEKVKEFLEKLEDSLAVSLGRYIGFEAPNLRYEPKTQC